MKFFKIKQEEIPAKNASLLELSGREAERISKN